MCLIDRKQFRCAEKDIPIFKMAIKLPTGEIVSPLLRTRLWRVNNITENYINECNANRFPGISSSYKFSEGFFHAFTNEYTANQCAKYFEQNPDYEIIVVTEYIPKDTRYAMNIWETEICARRMILNI